MSNLLQVQHETPQHYHRTQLAHYHSPKTRVATFRPYQKDWPEWVFPVGKWKSVGSLPKKSKQDVFFNKVFCMVVKTSTITHLYLQASCGNSSTTLQVTQIKRCKTNTNGSLQQRMWLQFAVSTVVRCRLRSIIGPFTQELNQQSLNCQGNI